MSPTLSHMCQWLWCMERNISLEAQHLPGVMNSIAERESRAWLNRSEWKLSPNIFQKINPQLGPLSTDLFTSRLSNQLLKFVRPSGHGDRCITRYISLMGDNHSLPLKSLSVKLVILLALSRPSRSHDLCKLDLTHIKSLPDGVEFKPSSLTKQSRPSSCFPAFPADKNLSPQEALLEYVSKTEAYRGSGSNRKTKLFLSYIKPHNPISSSPIARWILAMLSLADTDSEKFKAHSTSTSGAATAGITTNQILKQPIGTLNLFFNSSITSLPVQMLLECHCYQLL